MIKNILLYGQKDNNVKHVFLTKGEKNEKIFLTCALAFSVSACALSRTPIVNTANIDQVDFSKIDSMKKGRDCAFTFLMFGPFGNQKIVDAVKKAGISKVEIVDYDMHNYILAQTGCVEVYGH